MENQEKQRKALQDQLDAQKSHKARNLLGQFSTPYPLAADIMEYMKSLIGSNNVSLIEPAFGTGVFYSAYKEVFKGSQSRVLGIEIDPHYYNPANTIWKDYNIELRCSDFFSQEPDGLFDILVTNPPYIRHHYINNDTKVRLQNKVLRTTGIKISGLAGLYCYFIMLSSSWLRSGGYSCWLVPSEFMDVNYGEAIKQYLIQNVELVRIHRFKAEDNQFPDALVSSCIVVFRNNKPTNDKTITFSIGGTINAPESIKIIGRKQLNICDKWTKLFTDDNPIDRNNATIGDFFNVKRGIATGDNNFFIIDQSTIDRYQIPPQFLKPVLPSPRYIKGNRINSKNGLPLLQNQRFLFSCSLPESIIKEKYPNVWQYIHLGMELGVPQGYICSHRTPWYSCEEREPAKIVVPYMGRNNTSNRLFRFILNTSQAVTTNVYLLLYPKPQYAHCLKDEKMLSEIWNELNMIPCEILSHSGRFYGGGLRKMEPKELMSTPANRIASLFNAHSTSQQLEIFRFE